MTPLSRGLFLRELTICLFYDIEETRHSLNMRGLEVVDGGIEHPLLSPACLGSNPRPRQCYREALFTLLGSQPSPPKEPLGTFLEVLL